MKHIIENNPEINQLNDNLLIYTAEHCDSYGIQSALQDIGLEILVPRVSAEHPTPLRNEKSFKCAFNQNYKKLK